MSAGHHAYRLGHCLVCSDTTLPLMAVDPETGRSIPPGGLPGPPTSEAPAPGALIYEGPGWFAGGSRHVRCRKSGSDFLVDVEHVSRFRISEDGSWIRRLSDVDPEMDTHALWGPVIILALALQGLFTLHLSAVVWAGRVTGFLGDSGVGKSTTAEYLARRGRGRRVVDDMALFSVNGGMTLLPHLPQPKMPGGRPSNGLEYWPVERLLWLGETRQDEPGGIDALGRSETARRLVASTVGTRLFAPPLLARHFSACAKAAEKVAGFRSGLRKSESSLATISAWVGTAGAQVAGEV